MFKSVFTKHIVVFMAIIVIGYLALTAVLGVTADRYAAASNRKAQENFAYAIKNTVQKQFATSDYNDFNLFAYYESEALSRELDIVSQYSAGMHIFIVEPRGYLLVSDPDSEKYLQGMKLNPSALWYDEDGVYSAKSNLNGFLPTELLVYSLQLVHSTAVCGYVFVCSEQSNVASFAGDFMRTVSAASLLLLTVTLIAVYFISKRMIKPIREMSAVAGDFAKGKFDVRIPVRGRGELSELAIAFNNMALSLENTEQIRRDFIANISHELRTPMTSIAGFVDAMREGVIPEEKHDHYLEVISGEVKRLSRLVSSLLDITRIQAGEYKLHKTEFDICETARRIILSDEQRLVAKKLDVEFRCDEERMMVYADPDAVHQVLYNLCDNAIKFSKEGGKWRVSVLHSVEKIFVSVFNEGEGIPEQELPFVFGRFYKEDKSRALDQSGLGLGLYISKAILDAHGEEIWVKSESGSNCEFVFTLSKATAVPNELTKG